MEKILVLLMVGEIDPSILINLRDKLEHELTKFSFKVEISQKKLALTKSEYDSSRNQYNASKILKMIRMNMPKEKYFRILGVMNEDMYSKNYNFVFGLANRRSRIGIISLTRLREDYYRAFGNIYRKKETNEDFEERILKEALHELGHTFGLEHCSNHCVMKFSSSLMDTDKKPKEFCNICNDKLKSLLDQLT